MALGHSPLPQGPLGAARQAMQSSPLVALAAYVALGFLGVTFLITLVRLGTGQPRGSARPMHLCPLQLALLGSSAWACGRKLWLRLRCRPRCQRSPSAASLQVRMGLKYSSADARRGRTINKNKVSGAREEAWCLLREASWRSAELPSSVHSAQG